MGWQLRTPQGGSNYPGLRGKAMCPYELELLTHGGSLPSILQGVHPLARAANNTSSAASPINPTQSSSHHIDLTRALQDCSRLTA